MNYTELDDSDATLTVLVAIPQLTEQLYRVVVPPATTYQALCHQFTEEVLPPLLNNVHPLEDSTSLFAYFEELQSVDPFRAFSEQRLAVRTVIEAASDVAPSAWIVQDGGLVDCTMGMLRAALGLEEESCRDPHVFLDKSVHCVLLLRLVDTRPPPLNIASPRVIPHSVAPLERHSTTSETLQEGGAPPYDPSLLEERDRLPLKDVPLSLMDLTRRLRMLDSSRVLADVDLRLRRKEDDTERRVKYHI